MEKKRQYLVVAAALMALFSCGLLLVSCAGQRQGVVCDEIEYRYNSMSYSPDQRAFMEEELRACREEEAKKKQGSAEARRSIYERFASQDTTSKIHTASDSAVTVVPRDTTAAIPSDSSATPEPATLPDSAATESASAPADSSATVDSTASEVPQE